MRPAEKKQYTRQNEFNRTHYDRVSACVPKGTLDKVRAKAKEFDMTVNAYLKMLILDAVDDKPEQ